MIKVLSIGLFMLVVLGSSNVSAEEKQFVRKQLEPSFFVPESVKPKAENLALPKYREVEKEEFVGSNAKDNLEKSPVYKKKYNEYSKDLEHIKQTGNMPKNDNLNKDLEKMNSNDRVDVKDDVSKVKGTNISESKEFIPLF